MKNDVPDEQYTASRQANHSTSKSHRHARATTERSLILSGAVRQELQTRCPATSQAQSTEVPSTALHSARYLHYVAPNRIAVKSLGLGCQFTQHFTSHTHTHTVEGNYHKRPPELLEEASSCTVQTEREKMSGH